MKRGLGQSLKGFTIVELLIVVVVIAILAAIAVVSYNGIRGKAEHSAQLAELSQIQKKIQVEALQKDGVTINLSAPLVYTTASSIDTIAKFTRPLELTQEVTVYTVFRITGPSGIYIEISRLMPTSGVNNIYLSTQEGTYMGARVDTSVSTNQTLSSAPGVRDLVGRHVGWASAKRGGYESNYNSHAAVFRSLPDHIGWTFDSVRPNSSTGINIMANIVFPEYHNETTRQQVLRWLDRTHSIDFYN